MKIYVDSDEWYPVFYLVKESRYAATADVHPEIVARWEKVFADFDAVQNELEKLYQEE